MRRIRERRGWTQRDLADNTGLRQPYVSRLESGQLKPNRQAAAVLFELGIPLPSWDEEAEPGEGEEVSP